MKLLFSALLLIIGFTSYSQTVNQIRYDTTKFLKVGGFSEVKIQNTTKDSIGGIFTNVGNGWGQWKKPRAIPGGIVIGIDTVLVAGGGPSGAITALFRSIGTDSVYGVINGVAVFQFRDSTGNGIPLTGTEVGKPVTGAIEIQPYNARFYADDEDYGNILDISQVDIGVLISNSTVSGSFKNELLIGHGVTTISSNIPGSPGLTGQQDFTPNITALDYTQKKYVDSAIAASSSGGSGITLPQLTDSLNLIRAKHLADSTAQAAATNLKQNLVALTTIGSSGASTFNQSTGALNIPNYAGGGGGGIDSLRKKIGSDSTLQFSGGTGTFAFRNQRVFNVKDYGATGDSAQDATPFIQLAINDCILKGGGTVYFPNGFYWLSSPLVTSENGVNPNSQLYIPPASVTSSSKTHILFLGETIPNYTPVGLFTDEGFKRVGVVIKSTITGTGIVPSVFGGVGTGTYPNNFTYHYVSFENIVILVEAHASTTGPKMTGINGGSYASVNINNCMVGIDNSMYTSALPVNDVAGIITTRYYGETLNYVANTLVWGMRYGISAGEHTFLNNTHVFGSYAAYLIQSNGHPIYGTKIESQWNKYDIMIANSIVLNMPVNPSSTGAKLVIGLLDVETWNGGPIWFNNTATIVDSGGLGSGSIKYVVSPRAGIYGNKVFLNLSPNSNISSVPYNNAPNVIEYTDAQLFLKSTGAPGQASTVYNKNSTSYFQTVLDVSRNGTYDFALQDIQKNRVALYTYQGTLNLGGEARYNASSAISIDSNKIVSIPSFNTINSTFRVGSLEFQPYAKNNNWFGDNVFFNGSAFQTRAAGYGALFYFFNGEGQFRLSNTAAAGNTAISQNSYSQMKSNYDGSFATGFQLSGLSGNYNNAQFYVKGSNGNVMIGSTTDDVTNKLQVTGNVKATQYRLSALNTAPASATDTGTTGEIRVTAGFIYVCTATNTWVRTALSTF